MFLADVLEFVAAAIVVVLLTAACGRATENGEESNQEETECWQAGAHDPNADLQVEKLVCVSHAFGTFGTYLNRTPD